MTTGAINQMQMLYVAEEDRILFRVNSTDNKEFRFWLTRRYTGLLLQVLRKHVEADPDISTQATAAAKQAIRAFKEEAAVQEADFEQPFKDQAQEMPLGPEALLAFKTNYKFDGDLLRLGIEPKSGKGINLTINRQVNSSLTQLLVAAINRADWKIAPVTSIDPGTSSVVN